MLLKVATEKQFNQRTFAIHYLNQILLPFLTQKIDFAIYTLLALPLETTAVTAHFHITLRQWTCNEFISPMDFVGYYQYMFSVMNIISSTPYPVFSIFNILFWLITNRYGFIYALYMKIETPCAIVYRFFFECVKIPGYFNAF